MPTALDLQELVALYTNVGTNTSPEFELTNTDYVNAGFNNLGEDLVLPLATLMATMIRLAYWGDDRRDFYYENTGTFLAPSFTYKGGLQNIDVGNHSTPALGDLDGDGDLDLMIGNEGRTAAYYEHTGTYPNIFTLVDASWWYRHEYRLLQAAIQYPLLFTALTLPYL